MVAGRSNFVGVIALVLTAVLMAPPAAASPLQVRSDRSDNTFYFTYEAASGRITESSSSARFVRGDPVDFFVYVREARDGSLEGERLRARFTFELNKPRVVRYVGRFTLEVRDSLGGVVYRDRVSRKVVLRPQPGQRKKAFSVFFDLLTGSYETKAYFKASG